MIICLCRNVSERNLRAVIREGATTVCTVERQCGAGGDCGSCRKQIRDLIDEESGQEARPLAPYLVPLAGGFG
jgi:bacterioferritin-associated ferredoxin